MGRIEIRQINLINNHLKGSCGKCNTGKIQNGVRVRSREIHPYLKGLDSFLREKIIKPKSKSVSSVKNGEQRCPGRGNITRGCAVVRAPAIVQDLEQNKQTNRQTQRGFEAWGHRGSDTVNTQ